MEVLDEKGYVKQGRAKKKYIEIKDMPKPMRQLKAAEAEHMLCSMKDSMTQLEPTKRRNTLVWAKKPEPLTRVLQESGAKCCYETFVLNLG
ncbi:MAG: hypothetical protein QM642_10700 [Edaphocola sp.]